MDMLEPPALLNWEEKRSSIPSRLGDAAGAGQPSFTRRAPRSGSPVTRIPDI